MKYRYLKYFDCRMTNKQKFDTCHTAMRKKNRYIDKGQAIMMGKCHKSLSVSMEHI